MPEHWMPEDLRRYEAAIAAAQRQDVSEARRKGEWMDDFIGGKDMRGRPFDSPRTPTEGKE